MLWGLPQLPAMTNTTANIGAPGPFQSAFNIFSSYNRASDQGYVISEVICAYWQILGFTVCIRMYCGMFCGMYWRVLAWYVLWYVYVLYAMVCIGWYL